MHEHEGGGGGDLVAIFGMFGWTKSRLVRRLASCPSLSLCHVVHTNKRGCGYLRVAWPVPGGGSESVTASVRNKSDVALTHSLTHSPSVSTLVFLLLLNMLLLLFLVEFEFPPRLLLLLCCCC